MPSSISNDGRGEEVEPSTVLSAGGGRSLGKQSGDSVKTGSLHYEAGVYEGGIRDGKPHGRGVFRPANGSGGSFYAGEWADGSRHGRGSATTAGGDGYDGEFRENNMHGEGTFTWADGNVYEGGFREGKMHGQGLIKFPSGDIYAGVWTDGQREKKGEMKWANGNTQTGCFEWTDGRLRPSAPSNDATCTTSPDASLKKETDELAEVRTINYYNGTVYEGEVKDGNPHGRGVCRYANGAVYDGEWEDSKMHGRGVFRYAHGDVYDGEWEDDMKHGTGVYRYASGSVYDGEWKEDEHHGAGTKTWTDGAVYKGEWVEGKGQGWGTLTWASGSVYEGEWKEGTLHGKGTLKDATGRKTYEGHWVDGVWQQGIERLEKESTTCEDLAAPSSRDNMGGFAPNTSDNEPAKEKRIYIERQLRSQQSQKRRLEKNAAVNVCENCGLDDQNYKLRACSGCGLGLYCSLSCQRRKRGSHRRICSIISELPAKDADRLVLELDKDKMVDLDAGLRYATKYMDNLKHLELDTMKMDKDGAVKLSAKQLSSLLRSKKGTIASVSWISIGDTNVPGITRNGRVWNEMHSLKRLCLQCVEFGEARLIHDILLQQRNTLMVLSLPLLGIDWSRAKCRRTVAVAVNSCKHLVELNLSYGVLMDSDLKIMLHDLPYLRMLNLTRTPLDDHEFTDNTCGLIARKCPGLQELNLYRHNNLSVKGIRKIFEGCPHLRFLCTSSRKLSCGQLQNLLDIAPQLLYLSLENDRVADEDLDEIIEATGGRTLIQFSDNTGDFPLYEPKESISAETREKYERQKEVGREVVRRSDDPDVMNEWEHLFEG